MTPQEFAALLNGREYGEEITREEEALAKAHGLVVVFGYSWIYQTDIPHATFEIVEGDDPYCRGIVFALADAA